VSRLLLYASGWPLMPSRFVLCLLARCTVLFKLTLGRLGSPKLDLLSSVFCLPSPLCIPVLSTGLTTAESNPVTPLSLSSRASLCAAHPLSLLPNPYELRPRRPDFPSARATATPETSTLRKRRINLAQSLPAPQDSILAVTVASYK